VVLDEARVQVERHLLTANNERVHAREQLVKRAVQLAEVPERETPEEAPDRRRVGQAAAAQHRLPLVPAEQANIVEALTARNQHLAEGEDRLRRRVTSPAPLDADPVKQPWQPELLCKLADEHKPREDPGS